MRTGTRLLLGILPLFVVMAVAYGLTLWLLTRSEVRWAIEEPALSLARGTAAFVSPEEVSEALAGNDHGRLDERLRALLAWRHCDRIAILDAQGRVLRNYGGSWQPPLGLLPVSGERLRLQLDEGEAGAEQVLVVIALGDESESTGVAYHLAFRRPVTATVDHLDLAIVRIRQLAILIIAMGVLVLVPLALLITRSLRSLQRAAHGAVQQPGMLEPSAYRIREVADVDNALVTMSSVLADLVDQDRRGMILGEQRRGPEALAEAWRRRRAFPLVAEVAGLRLRLPYAVGNRRALLARMHGESRLDVVIVEAADTLQALLSLEAMQDLLARDGDVLCPRGVQRVRLHLDAEAVIIEHADGARERCPLPEQGALALVVEWQGGLRHAGSDLAQRVRTYAPLDADTQEDLLSRHDPRLFARLLLVQKYSHTDI